MNGRIIANNENEVEEMVLACFKKVLQHLHGEKPQNTSQL
jgi:hypothetical protein